jgi:hypothetical protein
MLEEGQHLFRRPLSSVILRSAATKDLRLLRMRSNDSQNSSFFRIDDNTTRTHRFLRRNSLQLRHFDVCEFLCL